MWRAVWLVASVFSAVSSCDDATKGKAAATVGSAVPIVDAGTPSTATVRYAVTSATSRIAFVGSKVTGKHEGSFGKFVGTIDVPGGKLEASALTIEIDAASLKTDDEDLDDHLKSKDFFDVGRFPSVSFTSTSIAPGSGTAGSTHTLSGNLALHGVTRSISVPATIKLEGGFVSATSEFTIKRRDFGIVYPGKPDDLIKDEVVVKVAIKAQRTG
jgi:polyisoprenoid-binding protein YceI